MLKPDQVAILLAMLCLFVLGALFAHEHEARLAAEAIATAKQ